MNACLTMRCTLAAWLVIAAQPVSALEYPVGAPQQRSGMEIALVYLQPVHMDPKAVLRTAEQSDIHLEADIRALENNPNGFAEGDWIPYLRVEYAIGKQGGKQERRGDLLPMVANDGPHYGDNVKLLGPGKYHLKCTIYPPNSPANPRGKYFARHSDRLTGVEPWFKPFTVQFDFVYVGIGKRGGY